MLTDTTYKTSKEGKKADGECETWGRAVLRITHYALRITHHYALQCVEVVSLRPVPAVLPAICIYLHL